MVSIVVCHRSRVTSHESRSVQPTFFPPKNGPNFVRQGMCANHRSFSLLSFFLIQTCFSRRPRHISVSISSLASLFLHNQTCLIISQSSRINFTLHHANQYTLTLLTEHTHHIIKWRLVVLLKIPTKLESFLL